MPATATAIRYRCLVLSKPFVDSARTHLDEVEVFQMDRLHLHVRRPRPNGTYGGHYCIPRESVLELSVEEVVR